jgi:hypothetical protein
MALRRIKKLKSKIGAAGPYPSKAYLSLASVNPLEALRAE